MNKGPCRGCGKEILFIRTTAGKFMPAEVEQTTIITPGGEVLSGHVPHWGNCPNAKEFKRSEPCPKKS